MFKWLFGWIFDKLLGFLMDICMWVIDKLVGMIGILPLVPTQVLDVVNTFFNFLLANNGLLGFLIDIDYVMMLLPIYLTIKYADKALKLFNFIIKKIPFID